MEPKLSAPTSALTGLPPLVAGPVDVGRLLRELAAIDETFLQQQLQHHEAKLGKTSKLMDELVSMNRLDLLNANDRTRLKAFLTAIKQRAPLLHLSFSTDPSPLFIEKLMLWLRQNIHPLVLVTIGLQPNIGAGCRLRTNNQYFDFSLGKRFEQSRGLLLQQLHAAVKTEPTT